MKISDDLIRLLAVIALAAIIGSVVANTAYHIVTGR